jgi:hypothetical protein
MTKETAKKAFWIVILTGLFATVSAGATSQARDTHRARGKASAPAAAATPLDYSELSCALSGPQGC